MFIGSIEKIQKAKRPKWARTRNGARLMALSKRMAGAVHIDLTKGIQTFKKKIDPEKVYRAWIQGDYTHIMRDIPWTELPKDIEPAYQKLDLTGVHSTAIATVALPPPVKENLRYDTKAPRLQGFIARRSGELITNIHGDTQKIVQNAVARSFNEALDPRTVAGLIRDSVGLNERQATALYNYRRGFQEKVNKLEITQAHADKMTDAYNERLLDQRTMMIARTETAFANNYGQLYVWQAASDQGLISSDAQKVWQVDGDPCEICEPMDGIAVGLAESWDLNNGDSVDIPNESHPNCYCVMMLDFGSSAEEHENNTPEPYDEY